MLPLASALGAAAVVRTYLALPAHAGRPRPPPRPRGGDPHRGRGAVARGAVRARPARGPRPAGDAGAARVGRGRGGRSTPTCCTTPRPRSPTGPRRSASSPRASAASPSASAACSAPSRTAGTRTCSCTPSWGPSSSCCRRTTSSPGASRSSTSSRCRRPRSSGASACSSRAWPSRARAFRRGRGDGTRQNSTTGRTGPPTSTARRHGPLPPSALLGRLSLESAPEADHPRRWPRVRDHRPRRVLVRGSPTLSGRRVRHAARLRRRVDRSGQRGSVGPHVLCRGCRRRMATCSCAAAGIRARRGWGGASSTTRGSLTRTPAGGESRVPRCRADRRRGTSRCRFRTVLCSCTRFAERTTCCCTIPWKTPSTSNRHPAPRRRACP